MNPKSQINTGLQKDTGQENFNDLDFDFCSGPLYTGEARLS
jgi:hypothetical protein